MGLDLVEFVMAVEEEFEVPIPAEDWGMLRTVGDMEAYIVRHQVPSGVCVNVPAFLKVRRALIGVCGLPRSTVRVKTSLGDVLPKGVRQIRWKQIGESLAVELPDLRAPIKLRFAILGFLAGLFLLLITAPVAFSWIDGVHPALHVLSIAAACASPMLVWIAGRVVNELVRPWKVQFAFFPPTVGGLTRHVARQDMLNSRIHASGECEPSDEIFQRLRSIITRTFNIPTDEIRRDSRFIEDLGLN